MLHGQSPLYGEGFLSRVNHMLFRTVHPWEAPGHYWRKVLVFSGLPSGHARKVFNLNWLWLKYSNIKGCGAFVASKEKAPVVAGAFFYLF
jgi:hypothetical protein